MDHLKRKLLLVLLVLLSICYLYFQSDVFFLAVLLVSIPAFYFNYPFGGPAAFASFFIFSGIVYFMGEWDLAFSLATLSFAYLAGAFFSVVMKFKS